MAIPAGILVEIDMLILKLILEIPIDLEEQKSFLKRIKLEKNNMISWFIIKLQ